MLVVVGCLHHLGRHHQNAAFGDDGLRIVALLEPAAGHRHKGFEVLPRRWVVERTFAWLGRCRRLGKDLENLSRNALAFLKLASIRLMLRRLCSN